jgi:ribosome-associated protein
MSDPDPQGGPQTHPESIELAVLAARVADEKKAHDIVVLDVGPVVSITGCFVVVSASNVRLVNLVAEEIEAVVKERLERAPARVEGMREKQWVLLDYGDVVVHVFLDEVREFYDIERLYRDVTRIAWQDIAPAAEA